MLKNSSLISLKKKKKNMDKAERPSVGIRSFRITNSYSATAVCMTEGINSCLVES